MPVSHPAINVALSAVPTVNLADCHPAELRLRIARFWYGLAMGGGLLWGLSCGVGVAKGCLLLGDAGCKIGRSTYTNSCDAVLPCVG